MRGIARIEAVRATVDVRSAMALRRAIKEELILHILIHKFLIKREPITAQCANIHHKVRVTLDDKLLGYMKL